MSALRERESRPTPQQGGIPNHYDNPSLPSADQAPQVGAPLPELTATIPTLDQLPARAQEIVLAYYEAGNREGYLRGWNAAQEAERAAWRAVAAAWGRPSQRPTHAELCERRGEPEKAEAHRRLLAERGVMA